MRIIYVDDEVPALQNFQLTVSKFPEIRSLELFGNGKDALRYIKEQPVETKLQYIREQPVETKPQCIRA